MMRCRTRTRRNRCVATAAACVMGLMLAGMANAEMIAYYRFEDKNGDPASAGDTLESPTPGGPSDVTSDSAGFNDALRVFHNPNDPSSSDFAERLETAPIFTANVPFPVVPSTGAPNLLAFDFDGLPPQDQQPPGTEPNQAGGDDVYTNQAGDLNPHDFNQFTVEASFRIDTLNRWQGIVTKDDGPDAAPGALSPFSMKVQAGNHLEVFAFDGDDDGSGVDFRGVLSNDPMEADVWYNVAVTNDGQTMRLYIDDIRDGVGDYVLQDSINTDIAGGALVESDAPWVIGRSWFNGPADFFDGQIDEVRISDVALDPSQFLFVPEPASAGLLGLGLLLLQRRRREA